MKKELLSRCYIELARVSHGEEATDGTLEILDELWDLMDKSERDKANETIRKMVGG